MKKITIEMLKNSISKLLAYLDKYNEKSKLYKIRYLYINLILIVIASRFEYSSKSLMDFGFIFLGIIAFLYLVKNRNKIILSCLKLAANILILMLLFFIANIFIFLYESQDSFSKGLDRNKYYITKLKQELYSKNEKIKLLGDYLSLNVLVDLNKEARLNYKNGFYLYLANNAIHDRPFDLSIKNESLNESNRYTVIDELKPLVMHEYNKYERTKYLKVDYLKDLDEIGDLYKSFIDREITIYSELLYLEDKFLEYTKLYVYAKTQSTIAVKNKHRKIIKDYIHKIKSLGGHGHSELLNKINININFNKSIRL